jgi:hypothetical protein
MFSLINQSVNINDINIRTENHGSDRVLAADLQLVATVKNKILTEFSPALMDALYQESNDDDTDQTELELHEPGDLTQIKFPNMSPFKWGDEYDDYALKMDYGIGGRSDLEQIGVKVNQFGFAPKDGGMVEIKFRLQIRPQTQDGDKLLAILLKGKTEITLTPPDPVAAEQKELVEAEE